MAEASTPATELADKVETALAAGASIARVRRRYHLSDSDLEDMGLAPDGDGDATRSEVTGY